MGVLAFIFAANSLILAYLQPDDFERGWKYGGVGGAKYWMPNYNPVGFFAHYIMGIFAAGFIVLFEKNKLVREKLSAINLFDILSVTGLVSFTTILWTQRAAPDFSFSLQNQPYYYPALAFSIALVVATTPYSKWVGHILDNPFSRYTAKISFGLYVWHYFVLSFFHPQIPFGITDVGQWFTVGCAVIAISYIVASLSWYYLEKPVLDAVCNRGKENVLTQNIVGK